MLKIFLIKMKIGFTLLPLLLMSQRPPVNVVIVTTQNVITTKATRTVTGSTISTILSTVEPTDDIFNIKLKTETVSNNFKFNSTYNEPPSSSPVNTTSAYLIVVIVCSILVFIGILGFLHVLYRRRKTEDQENMHMASKIRAPKRNFPKRKNRQKHLAHHAEALLEFNRMLEDELNYRDSVLTKSTAFENLSYTSFLSERLNSRSIATSAFYTDESGSICTVGISDNGHKSVSGSIDDRGRGENFDNNDRYIQRNSDYYNGTNSERFTGIDGEGI